MWKSVFAIILAAAWAAPSEAQEADLRSHVEAALSHAAPGTRFGLVVVDDQGRDIITINPDQRFMPASTTKMFTTAAAFATLGDVTEPDTSGGAAVRLEGDDVVLIGHGDARLSSADDCTVDCLSTLADAVAAKTKTVRTITGDDTLFPDERWSPGMSWNNIPTRSGTGISALTLDDNELVVTVRPATNGAAPRVSLPPYYTLENRAVTVEGGSTDLGFDRAPNGFTLRLTGTIGTSVAHPERLRIAIDDPARYAAWRFRQMLKARGVKVTGKIAVRHRALTATDDPARRGAAPPVRPPVSLVLAQLTPAPLIDDLAIINKHSQNLHAELLLRRIGLAHGSGSIADGLVAVRAVLAGAGVPRASYDFSDGSGMSTYNRVAPRAAVLLLRWIARQSWGAAWRQTLPVGGTDGTLARRFVGTSLERKVFGKTGSLNATAALSGYMISKRGKTLTFALYANDVPDGASATPAMDIALELVASAN